MTTYRVGVAVEKLMEIEARNAHEAIRDALALAAEDGRKVHGAHRVERVEEEDG